MSRFWVINSENVMKKPVPGTAPTEWALATFDSEGEARAFVEEATRQGKFKAGWILEVEHAEPVTVLTEMKVVVMFGSKEAPKP